MNRIAHVALAALLLLPACASEPGSADSATRSAAPLTVPQETPDIIGTVESVTESGPNRVVLIRQVPERSAGYPSASVTIRAETQVGRRQGESVASARAGDLRQGTKVHAWFTGPVRESFPVQADARAVLIVD